MPGVLQHHSKGLLTKNSQNETPHSMQGCRDAPCIWKGAETLSLPRVTLGRSIAGCLSRWRAVKLSMRESSCTKTTVSRVN